MKVVSSIGEKSIPTKVTRASISLDDLWYFLIVIKLYTLKRIGKLNARKRINKVSISTELGSLPITKPRGQPVFEP